MEEDSQNSSIHTNDLITECSLEKSSASIISSPSSKSVELDNELYELIDKLPKTKIGL